MSCSFNTIIRIIFLNGFLIMELPLYRNLGIRKGMKKSNKGEDLLTSFVERSEVAWHRGIPSLDCPLWSERDVVLSLLWPWSQVLTMTSDYQ